MSNHHHTGIEDPEGNYPEFLEHFHKLFAKCQNALRGRWENFWSSEQTSVVRLTEADDIMAKMTYALSNPVKDGLVEKAHHWPGVSSLDATTHDKPLVASRPKHFFREEGIMPELVSLPFSRPREFKDVTSKEFAARVVKAVQVVEQSAAAERRRTGARVVGRRGVLDQQWSDRPSSREPRRQLNPRVAAWNKWSRIEALLRNRAFRDAYAAARAAYATGIRNIIFPAGTYWLRRFTQALCDTCPAPT
jgi:hypothetical protein